MYLIAHCHVSVCWTLPLRFFFVSLLRTAALNATLLVISILILLFYCEKSELLLLNILSARQYSLQSRLRAYTAAEKNANLNEKIFLVVIKFCFFHFLLLFCWLIPIILCFSLFAGGEVRSRKRTCHVQKALTD